MAKDDIVKLKKIVDYSNRMKDLISKITTLKENANFSEALKKYGILRLKCFLLLPTILMIKMLRTSSGQTCIKHFSWYEKAEMKKIYIVRNSGILFFFLFSPCIKYVLPLKNTLQRI